MSSFSTIACYAALSSCSREDILHAYARMIAALIQRNRYKTCDTDTLCKDFKAYYGFSVPYHPMQTILSTCINFGFLTYNSSIHQFVPDYAHIDEEDFMDIVEKTDQKYREILAQFKIFLQQEYNIYSSDEDMDDKILAFIERYGIKTKVDRMVLREVKDDYLFAAFLVHCEETGQTDILDYLILKEIRQSAYTEGSISRQEEIDNLTRKNETAEFELAKAKQQRIIFECQRNVEVLEKDRTDVKKEIEDVSEFLSEQNQVKDAIDKSVNKQILGLKIIITIASLIAIGLAVYIGTNYSEVLGIITAVISIFIIILTIWNKDEIKILSLISKARKALFNRQANLRRYSAEKVEQAVHQKERAEEKLVLIDANLREARKELHQESTKPDRFSADISILQS